MMTSRRIAIVSGLFAVFAAVAALPAAMPAAGSPSKIDVTSVAGFPNGRTANGDLPPNAIDEDITTFTWTTNAYNTESPSHLAIGFDSTAVNRLRLWKDSWGGGGNNSKNLTIQYTTDGGPLHDRSWTTVTNLTNGFMGTELLQATSVNANGTVTGDVHVSDAPAAHGWASLTFDPVMATGLRISFSNPNPIYSFCNGVTADQTCNHYRVGEFEAYFDGPPPDTTPPLITSNVIGTVSNGWYTSDVSLTWTVTEPESTGSLVETGCADQLIVADQPQTTYSCSASSDGGSAGPETVDIKRDATKPTVTYAGNAGSYTVADDVSVTCTPADNLSGVASSTCANVAGTAWSFGLGSHSFSASATDNAGNTGNGATAFTVTVDFDSLCALVAELSTNPGVTQGLCAKLSAAEAKSASGQTNAKNNILNAFNNQVDAQRGKAFTLPQAVLLKSLAGTL